MRDETIEGPGADTLFVPIGDYGPDIGNSGCENFHRAITELIARVSRPQPPQQVERRMRQPRTKTQIGSSQPCASKISVKESSSI